MQALPALETYLDRHAASWEAMPVEAYERVIADWSAQYQLPIQQRESHLQGARAMHAFRSMLPSDVHLFSGLPIPEIANLGGRGAAGYVAIELRDLDPYLGSSLELVVVAQDLAWCLLLSHETGTWYDEEFWSR